MSEQWPQFGSHEPNAESEDAGSSSANGADPEDAIGVADTSVEQAVAIHDEATDESPAAADPADEPAISAATDGATGASVEPADTDEAAVFVAELVRAMQTTAGAERVRTAEDTERRRQTHIDAIRAREASEADRIRELAAEDMKAIEAWADDETKRIQLERERRATELNKDLETSLTEHHAKIDGEIESVETAIATYRSDVETFFRELDRETDPILIAQHAGRRPVFPELEATAEAAAVTAPEAPLADAPLAESADAAASLAEPSSLAETAEAAVTTSADAPLAESAPVPESPAGVDADAAASETAQPAEPAVLGVMAPNAADEPVESWTAPAQTAPEAAEAAEPVTAATGSSLGSPGSLIQSVPIHRPMSWLRRDQNGGDRSNPDS